MLCALALERNLADVADALGAATIDHVVLKGPAVAHEGYPDPSWRPFGDVDVLVPSGRFDAACGILSNLGYRRTFLDPRPGFAARFGKGAAHVGTDGLEVDLHRLIADGPFGYWVDHDTILRSTTPFALGGRSFERLNDTALVLHACLHAVLGGPRPDLAPDPGHRATLCDATTSDGAFSRDGGGVGACEPSWNERWTSSSNTWATSRFRRALVNCAGP